MNKFTGVETLVEMKHLQTSKSEVFNLWAMAQ